MKRRIGSLLSVVLLFLLFGGNLNEQTSVVYANNGRVSTQRQMSYSNNRPLLDGDYYWKSSRVREWLHSTSTNPPYTNRGTVARQTRGFLSGFTTAERNQIAITRRQTPVRHEWAGGLTFAERLGSSNFHGDDGLASMRPYSTRYHGHPSGVGDPMVTRTWRATITHDQVFIPNAWEIQRYVESRGWSMARDNTDGAGNTDAGYWIGGTQTYTANISRGVYIDDEGRVAHGHIRNLNRGIVPMLHLKPSAAAGQNKRVGDTLQFGNYNSDNPEGHRGAIEWLVVNETPDGHKLIMAKYAVDHFPYNVFPGGDPNNAAFARSNHVNFSGHDIDIIDNLLFQNTDANGTYITGRPAQPWFSVTNPAEFYRRNTSGARFNIQGREVSSRSINRIWLGGNFVSGRFNRGSQTTSGAGPIRYQLSENDPGGRDTVITIQNDRNVFMNGHLPFNMIDRDVNLDVDYDLPYNGYAANNQYVDVDVGLSNWNVNRTIPRWHNRVSGQGQIAVFMPPAHTTYAGTRYRMSGRMRVTDWGDLHQALTPAQWNTTGFAHRSYSIVLAQPSYLYDMYLPGSWYNTSGGDYEYDGSVDDSLFMPWSRLRDAGGSGWVNFDTVMPVPETWLSFTGNGLGIRANPNITTNSYQWPIIEIENWTFELVDDQLFTLDWLRLPNGVTINNPPVGSMNTHRVTSTGNYGFTARDSRGYTWDTTANIRIDKSAPTGSTSQNPTAPTNGNVTITLDSRDNESGLSRVEYISGGTVSSQNVPAINQNNFVQTHRSTFTVTQNGTYRFRITDRAGNTREVTRSITNIDRSNPSTSVSQTPTGWTNQNVTVNWTANAQGVSDLSRVRFNDGSGWSAWTATSGRTRTFNRTATSNRTMQFQVEDQAGNISTRTHTVENIDTDNPVPAFTHSPNAWTNQNVTTTIRARDFGPASGTSGLLRLRMRPQNGTWSSWTNYSGETERSTAWYEQTRTITSNGTYEVQVEDRAGNVNTQSFTVNWIDRSMPNVNSSQSPTAWTNGNVTITWSGVGTGSPIRRTRIYDGAVWSGWTTHNTAAFSRTQVVSSNGTYRIQVEDQAGNTREITHTVNNIDKTAPNMDVTILDTAWTNGSVRVSETVNDRGDTGQNQHISGVNRIRVRRDSGTWDAWSPYDASSAQTTNNFTRTWSIDANGTYEWRLEDRAGNVRSLTRTVTNIDRSIPTGSTNHMSNWTNGNVWIDVTGQDQVSGLASIRYVSGGTITGSTNFTFTGTTSAQTVRFTATQNGTYSFDITDRAGNVRRVTQVVDNIDRTVPQASTTQTPTGWTNQNVVIRLTGGDLNGQGTRISGVDRVRMRPVGASTWTETRAITDSTESSPNFNALNFTVSTNGRYQFELRDRAGNISIVEHTVGNIDKGIPNIRSSQTPTAWTNGNVTLTLEARDFGEQNGQSTHISGIASIQVRRPDGTTWNDTYGAASENSATYYGRTFTATVNGTYVVTVTDRAGNTATHNHTVSNIDRSIPTGSTNHMSNWTNGNVWIDVTGRDTTSGLASIRYVSGGSVTGSTSFSYNGTTVAQTARFTATQNGTYTFDITDRAGNVRRVTQVVDNIDRTAPNGSLTQTPTTWTNQNVTLRLSGGDTNGQGTRISGVDRVRMRPVGASTWTETRAITDSTESSPNFNALNFTVSTNGRYQFELRDRAGNIRLIEHTVSNIDRVAPNMDLTLLNTNWTNEPVQMRTTVNDRGDTGENQHISGIHRIRMRPQGGSWGAWRTFAVGTERQPANYNETWTINESGTYEWQLEDRAGNVRNVTRAVTNIDYSVPTGSTNHMSNWTNGNVWIDVTGQDQVSGLASIRYVSGGTITGSTSFPFTGQTTSQTVRFTATQNGTYSFDITDRAGNVRRVTQTVSNIDRSGPEATTRLSPNSWTNQNVNMIISGRDLNGQGTRISGVDQIRMRLAGSSTWLATQSVTDSTESSPAFNDRTFTATENGVYEFELRDRAGNTSIVRQTVDRIDRTPPTANGTFVPNGWTNQNITITWVGERTGNPGSPLRRYRTHNGTSWSSWQNASNPDRITVDQTVSSNGTYRFEVQDEAGNVAPANVVVTQYDNVAPTGNIRARFDRTEQEVSDGSVVDVNMIDQQRVTVDVFDVEDLGISGIAFVEIEEQHRMGSIDSMTGGSVDDWQTVETYRYDWPHPYDISEQTYHIDVKHALDTRFVLVVQDRAGNRSEYATSNPVRHSVLQFDDLRITDVVNPELTQEEVDALRDIDLSLDSVPVTAGTNVTFELSYTLRHLDTVERVVGDIVVSVIDDSDTVTPITQIQIDEPTTGHNQRRTVERTFTVPEGTPRDATIQIYGNLLVELENGTQHMIWYPNNDSIGSIIGSVDNHLEEFFRFRIIR